jgi:hypothetical protein
MGQSPVAALVSFIVISADHSPLMGVLPLPCIDGIPGVC